jgi:hypothetical protein
MVLCLSHIRYVAPTKKWCDMNELQKMWKDIDCHFKVPSQQSSGVSDENYESHSQFNLCLG